MNTHTGDKQKDRTPDQQIKGGSDEINMVNGIQDHNVGYEAPRTDIMKNTQKSRSGEIRIRSGHISHRLERPGN